MKSNFEKAYYRLPVWLQNILISVYGYKINRIQHGGEYKKLLEEISRNQALSRDQIIEYQNRKLRQLVVESVQNVPYYKALFEKEKIDINNINSIYDLERIPLLNKEILRKKPQSLINRNYKRNKLHSISTSGTTGTPLKIYFNSKARQLNYAFYNRFLESAGVNFNGGRATFAGRIIVANKQKAPPFWRYSYFQKNLLFSSYHITDKNIPFYIKQLKRYNPEYIETYPSSIFAIARFMLDNNISGKEITNAIITSAECLFNNQRKIIESVFNVPVIDQYGSAEMCAFIGQCRVGCYHINMDYGVVEFLRQDGTQAKAGEEAEIVCTGFINPAMPLIRYRIGDRGILSENPCSCGSPFPLIEKILGRMDDVIITPDGRKVSRFGSVLYGLPVKEVQYVQKSVGTLDIYIVKGSAYTENVEQQIEKELIKRLGDRLSFRFNYVDKIPRSSGGKLKTVISNKQMV